MICDACLCVWQNMRGAETVVAAALAEANLTVNKHKHWHPKGNLVCNVCADVNAQHYHRSKQKMHVTGDDHVSKYSNVTIYAGKSVVCPLPG